MSLLLLFNTPAPVFTFVQKAWNSTAGGAPATTTLSLPSVGAGHLVCVSVEYLGTSTGFTMTLTDGNGHSFTLTPNSPFQYNSAARYIWLGYILSAASGTMTITATPSVAHGVSIHAAEFSYSGTVTFDKDAGAFSATDTTPANTPSISLANLNELIYGAVIADPAGSGSISGVSSPWVDGTRGVIASDNSNSSDAYILGASGTVPAAWAISSSTGTGWNAAMMAFSLSAGNNTTLSVTDTLSFSETIARLVALSRAQADSVSFSEAAARTAGLSRPASDSLSFSDNPARILALLRSFFDSLSFSENLARTVALARAITDSLSFSEATLASRGVLRNVSDTTSFSDSTARSIALNRPTTDTLSFSEALARIVATVRAVSAALSFSEATTASRGVARSASDTVSFSDSVNRSIALLHGVSDTFSFSDTAARLITLGKLLTDTVVFSDTVARVAGHTRPVVDTQTASDTVARTFAAARIAADAFTVSETLTRQLAAGRTATDNLAVSDAAARIVHLARTAADTFAFSESFGPAGQHLVIAVTDALSFTDSVTRHAGLSRAAAETLVCLDSLQLILGFISWTSRQPVIDIALAAAAWRAANPDAPIGTQFAEAESTDQDAAQIFRQAQQDLVVDGTWTGHQPVVDIEQKESVAQTWSKDQPIIR